MLFSFNTQGQVCLGDIIWDRHLVKLRPAPEEGRKHPWEKQKCQGDGRGNCAANPSHRDFTIF